MTTTSASFTCASCRVIFENVEDQRTHYQSEWHRYNLRRKVSDLPPVTESVYKQRVTSAATSKADSEAREAEAAKSRECTACKKVFSSEAAFENHVQSRKHQEQVAKQGQAGVRVFDRNGEQVSAEAKPISVLHSLPENASEEQVDQALKAYLEKKPCLELTDCFFCPNRSGSMEENIEHMHSQHSFYIPDIDYLKDKEGLMKVLAEKVSVWHVCLACGDEKKQPFASLEAVRRHMLDKGHNKIRFDDLGSGELADFYDYSSLRTRPQMQEVEYNSDDFITDDEEGDEEYIDDNALILAPDESELMLPSGARLGSRAYRHYYRQNLVPYLSEESRPNALRPVNPPRPDGTVVRGQHYVPPPRVMDAQEKRDRKLEVEAQINFALRKGVKQNGLQTYYREQYMQ